MTAQAHQHQTVFSASWVYAEGAMDQVHHLIEDTIDADNPRPAQLVKALLVLLPNMNTAGVSKYALGFASKNLFYLFLYTMQQLDETEHTMQQLDETEHTMQQLDETEHTMQRLDETEQATAPVQGGRLSQMLLQLTSGRRFATPAVLGS